MLLRRRPRSGHRSARHLVRRYRQCDSRVARSVRKVVRETFNALARRTRTFSSDIDVVRSHDRCRTANAHPSFAIVTASRRVRRVARRSSRANIRKHGTTTVLNDGFTLGVDRGRGRHASKSTTTLDNARDGSSSNETDDRPHVGVMCNIISRGVTRDVSMAVEMSILDIYHVRVLHTRRVQFARDFQTDKQSSGHTCSSAPLGPRRHRSSTTRSRVIECSRCLLLRLPCAYSTRTVRGIALGGMRPSRSASTLLSSTTYLLIVDHE